MTTTTIKPNCSKNKKKILYSTVTAAILISSIFAIAGANSLVMPTTITTKNAFAIQEGANIQSIEPALMHINSGAQPSVDIFNLPDGYTIQPIVWNLTLSSAVAFDGNGSMYIAESGYAYGGFKPQPRILKVDQTGNVSIFADRMMDGPITDIEFNKDNGLLYVSHLGVVSTIDSQGRIKDIIIGLPVTRQSSHHNNQIAFGPDGKLYIGVGTLTNTAVIGTFDFLQGWLKVARQMHDIPGQNITLTGQNFQSDNRFTAEPGDNATTGAYVPYGTSTTENQVIKGDEKCTGCIIRANPDGTELELVGWGFRNPYGLAFTEDGRLFASENGIDDKMMDSRPVANDSDKFRELDLNQLGGFYGWPDFAGMAEPVTDPKFKPERGPQPQFLIQDHPPIAREPLTLIGTAVGATQVDFARGGQEFFVPQGENVTGGGPVAFVGEFGSLAPVTHPPQVIPPGHNVTSTQEIVGQKVIAVDISNGEITDFMSLNRPDPSFRPVGIAFNEDESALYIASIAKAEIREELPNGAPLPNPTPWFYPMTGVIWKVTFTGETAVTGAAEAEQGQAPALFGNQTTIANATTTTTANATQQEVNQLPGVAEGEATTAAGTEEGTTTITTDGNGDDEEGNEQDNGEE